MEIENGMLCIRMLGNNQRVEVKEIRFDKKNGATIVFWTDNTKTVVATRNGETFDSEKGIALCFMKKQLGNTGSYNEIFKTWITE